MTQAAPKIYAVATGAYGNVGDAIIRRRAMLWLDQIESDSWHVYVGSAPSEWVDQLDLAVGTRVYRRKSQWKWLAGAAFSRGPRVLLLDPGEVPLALQDLVPEVVMMALTWILRLRSSPVIRPPRGIGRASRLGVLVHRLAVRGSAVALWRNQTSLELIGRGTLAPDTAFSETIDAGQPWESREVLFASFRGARPYPSQAVLDALRQIADEHGIRLVFGSQVRADESRNREIAESLGVEHITWAATDRDQETELKAIYDRSKIVVSDRLHVLILAALRGAVPAEMVDAPQPKVRITFERIGIDGVSIEPSNVEASVEQAGQLIGRRSEIAGKVAAAQAELAAHISLVQRVASGGRQ